MNRAQLAAKRAERLEMAITDLLFIATSLGAQPTQWDRICKQRELLAASREYANALRNISRKDSQP